MPFEPKPGMSIELAGFVIKFIPLVSSGPASVFVYAEAGKEGIVYKVLKGDEYYALKVFYSDHQDEQLINRTKILNQYKNLAGFQVAERIVINSELSPRMLDKYPELKYSVLMPWIEGTVWGNLMVNENPLHQEQYFKVAQLFLKSIYAIESQGLAHCDLSNNNFIINPLLSSIELIDVENMYAPGMPHPFPDISFGTMGYRTKWIAENGLWGSSSDRFASAILCAEITTWHNKEIRENRYGNASFFDEAEIGLDSERFRIMKTYLSKISSDLSVLFEKAWFSENSEQCPPIAEWMNAVKKNNIVAKVDDTVGKSPLTNSFPKAPTDLLKDKSTIRQIDGMIDVKMGLPDGNSSRRVKLHFMILFIAAGLLSGFALIISGLVVKVIYPSLITGASNVFREIVDFFFAVIGSIVYTGLLALVVGIIQTLLFRGRIKAGQFAFLSLSGLGGAVSGTVGGIAFYFLAIFNANFASKNWTPTYSKMALTLLWSFEGLILGLLIGGIISIAISLFQNYLIKGSKYRFRWFMYNLISWSIICSIGWALIFGINVLAPFPFVGDAIASIFILGAHGLGIVAFLHYSPHIEFS